MTTASRTLGDHLFGPIGITIIAPLALVAVSWVVLHLGFTVPRVGTALTVIGGLTVAVGIVGAGVALVFRDDDPKATVPFSARGATH